MSYRKFSRALRRSICIEYMQSGKSRAEITLKYGLPNVNTLSSWVNSCLTPLEIHEKCASLPAVNPQTDSEMEEKDASKNVSVHEQSELISTLEGQIKTLEAKLKRSEDKNLALNTLIDIAEEQGLKIRKKSGVKQ